MNSYEQIKAALESIAIDAEKFYVKGNAQAGKRLRAGFKTIADAAKNGRKEVSALKAERSATKEATA